MRRRARLGEIAPRSASQSTATFTEIFEGFEGRQPDVGESAPVSFDKKREVKFDRSALHEEWKAAEAARKSGFEALGQEPPGTAPSSARAE